MSCYHDLRCPKCGTTQINTSEILKEDSEYGFGNNNFLIIQEARKTTYGV